VEDVSSSLLFVLLWFISTFYSRKSFISLVNKLNLGIFVMRKRKLFQIGIHEF